MTNDTKAQRERLTSPLSVGMTASERKTVRYAAYLSDATVSAFIREAAVRAATRLVRAQDAGAQKAA